MPICNKCNLEKEIKKPNLQCVQCLNEYKKNWRRKNKNRKCSYCQKEYIPKAKDKQCCIECKILGNIKKNNDCWEWGLAYGRGGYGKIIYEKKTCIAHRISYEIFIGKFDLSLQVCHKCDNPKCVNPDHLFLGNQKENVEDCIRKNRRNTAKGWFHKPETKLLFKDRKRGDVKGEKHPMKKLDNEKIITIKNMYDMGYTQKEIAKQFDVDQSCISYIVRGKRWGHL